MPLESGIRIGAYEVVSLLGAGGMGEVYRAVDTRLKREVALKVLPSSLGADADRLLRFAREAEMLAALNHPNIAAIYGVEEGAAEGRDAGRQMALVMELVDGETLADRIARGSIPVDEALPIARDIAEAVGFAHEQGIVHRDLKPANIKVRGDGTVKVLDFGLAKLAEPAGATASSSGSLSPTITSPALMTNAGMLLGTAAYMSPEQAKGKPADKRSDMWAFGCVLFEMLAGKRAFEGEDISETLASVLRSEPDWSALPAGTPPAVRTLIRRCLEKDRRKRAADCAAALFALDEHPNLLAPAPPVDRAAFQQELDTALRDTRRVVEQHERRRLLGGALAAVLLTVAAVGVTWWLTRPPSARVSYLAMPPSTSITAAPSILTIGVDLTITSDGSRIVYQTGGNATSVAVRALDQIEPVALGVSGGGPFLSPDNQWVGFYNVPGNSISKVSILGGPVVPVATSVLSMRGASWAPDDTIIFGEASGGLRRVAASGGTPTTLTEIPAGKSERHNWPSVLPGGRAVVFTSISTTVDDAQIGLLDLQTKQTRIIIPRGTYPRYSKTGHLLYAAAGTLFAVGFDLDRLSVTTAPVPLIEGVVTKESGAADFAIADNGTLVFIGGSGATSNRAIVWVGRDGRQQPVPGISPGEYRSVRVAPDGTQAVFEEGPDGNARIWIYDVARATRNPLATGPGDARSPLWTPDGRRIVFASNRDGKSGIFAINADGTGQVDRLAIVEKAAEVWPKAWSSDGKKLIVSMNTTINAAPDIMAISLPDGKAEPIVDDTIVETYPAISPNGDWIAYMAIRSGRPDVYVERFPARSNRRPVSTDGGQQPSWSADRRELYYHRASSGEMMVVPIMALSPELVLGPPKPLFKVALATGRIWQAYDQMRDGRFILMLRSESAERDATVPTLNVVQNWGEELKRRVPVQ